VARFCTQLIGSMRFPAGCAQGLRFTSLLQGLANLEAARRFPMRAYGMKTNGNGLRMVQRFKVFTQSGARTPVFSAPWYWLASLVATFRYGKGDYCRIQDGRTGVTMMEWKRVKSVR
jgi:hypothetical protein